HALFDYIANQKNTFADPSLGPHLFDHPIKQKEWDDRMQKERIQTQPKTWLNTLGKVLLFSTCFSSLYPLLGSALQKVVDTTEKTHLLALGVPLVASSMLTKNPKLSIATGILGHVGHALGANSNENVGLYIRANRVQFTGGVVGSIGGSAPSQEATASIGHVFAALSNEVQPLAPTQQQVAAPTPQELAPAGKNVFVVQGPVIIEPHITYHQTEDCSLFSCAQEVTKNVQPTIILAGPSGTELNADSVSVTSAIFMNPPEASTVISARGNIALDSETAYSYSKESGGLSKTHSQYDEKPAPLIVTGDLICSSSKGNITLNGFVPSPKSTLECKAPNGSIAVTKPILNHARKTSGIFVSAGVNALGAVGAEVSSHNGLSTYAVIPFKNLMNAVEGTTVFEKALAAHTGVHQAISLASGVNNPASLVSVSASLGYTTSKHFWQTPGPGDLIGLKAITLIARSILIRVSLYADHAITLKADHIYIVPPTLESTSRTPSMAISASVSLNGAISVSPSFSTSSGKFLYHIPLSISSPNVFIESTSLELTRTTIGAHHGHLNTPEIILHNPQDIAHTTSQSISVGGTWSYLKNQQSHLRHGASSIVFTHIDHPFNYAIQGGFVENSKNQQLSIQGYTLADKSYGSKTAIIVSPQALISDVSHLYEMFKPTLEPSSQTPRYKTSASSTTARYQAYKPTASKNQPLSTKTPQSKPLKPKTPSKPHLNQDKVQDFWEAFQKGAAEGSMKSLLSTAELLNDLQSLFRTTHPAIRLYRSAAEPKSLEKDDVALIHSTADVVAGIGTVVKYIGKATHPTTQQTTPFQLSVYADKALKAYNPMSVIAITHWLGMPHDPTTSAHLMSFAQMQQAVDLAGSFLSSLEPHDYGYYAGLGTGFVGTEFLTDFMTGGLGAIGSGIKAIKPLAYSARMEEVTRQINTVIARSSYLEDTVFKALRHESSYLEQILPTYPGGHSLHELERIWLSAIEGHTTPFTTTEHQAVYLKQLDRLVCRLEVGERKYIIKANRDNPLMALAELASLNDLHALQLRHLDLPSPVIIGTTGLDDRQSIAKYFIAKEFLEGNTLSASFERMAELPRGSSELKILKNDLLDVAELTGKALGELHAKTVKIEEQSNLGELNMILDRFHQSFIYTDIELNRINLPKLHPFIYELIGKAYEEPLLPFARGFKDIHGGQFIWSKTNGQLRLGYIDAEEVSKTYHGHNAHPVALPILEYRKFLDEYSIMGQDVHASPKYIESLRQRFHQGYVSEYTVQTPAAIQHVLEIDSAVINILHDLKAHGFSPEQIPVYLFKEAETAIYKLNKKLKDLEQSWKG
ncbi:MAG: hypothetical protein WCG10_05905, partial [Chlamydiota bacterium]